VNHVPHAQLEKLVQYLYSTDYNEIIPTVAETSLFQLHARMFSLADAYDIPKLRTVAADKYSAHCFTIWKVSDFFLSIRDVYDETRPSALRQIACKAIRGKLPALANDKVVGKHFSHSIVDNPDFAKDFL
jgi:hypothetical protein